MLTGQDYESLRNSAKGWTAKRLAAYGIAWPPVKGWRTKLLREYEKHAGLPKAKTLPHPPRQQRTDAPKQESLPFAGRKRTPAEWEAINGKLRYFWKEKDRI